MSRERLDGRVAIVTGAATGLGRATAMRLASLGASVIINHPHTPEPAAAVVAEISAAGGRARALPADVSDEGALAGLVDDVLATEGRWDILVNNGAITHTRPVRDFAEDEIDAMFAVNVKGVLWGCRLALEHMADGGRVITIGSSTTGLMLDGYAVYDATKAAAHQFTRILSRDFGTRGITINTVSPGATETESYRAGRGEERVAAFAALSAFGRLGQPAEIADVVAFVASDAARWITGQDLRVNGGTVA